MSQYISSTQIPVQTPKCFNSLWFALHGSKVLLVCVYLPPSSVLSSTQDIIEFLISRCDAALSSYPEYDVILCGDLNRLPMKDIASSLDLVDLVREPTRGDVTLDHVFVSSGLAFAYDVSVTAPISNSDHCSVQALPVYPSLTKGQFHSIHFDLRRRKLDDVVQMLDINWSSYYSLNMNVDEKCEIFHDFLNYCVNVCIPQFQVLMSTSDKPWITPFVKFTIQKRWDAFRLKNFDAYRYWKVIASKVIIKAKENWARRASHSSRNLWKVVNSTLGTKSSNVMTKLYSDFPSIEAAAEHINRSFASHFSAPTGRRTPAKEEHEDNENDWELLISVKDVERKLSQLKPHKASGSDRIPTVVYKHAASVLAGPLTHIFNQSIRERCFPKIWKYSHMIPLPKSQRPNLANIRPISLLPVPSKLLEWFVLHSSLYAQMLHGFGPLQYGSRPNSSTTCALISFVDNIVKALTNPTTVGVQVLAYDFTKAFDTVSHISILKRLKDLGFQKGFIEWTADYLNDRYHSTRIATTISSYSPVTSGIPQGSVLGPAYYCLVAGDLQTCHDSSFLMKYVDDTTYVVPINKSGCSQVLSEHNNILSWSKSKGLQLNLSKSKTLFIRKSTFATPVILPSIESVHEIKLLGVIVNERLRWDSHIDYATKLASRKLYALRTLRPLLHREDLKSVYAALIRPVLEYASQVFPDLPSFLEKKLNRIQERAHRLICSHSSCQCGSFECLRSRRISSAIRLFVTASTHENHILHDIIPPRSSRSGRFIQPPSDTKRFFKTFVPFITAQVNQTFVE